jgi:hypothetical protein
VNNVEKKFYDICPWVIVEVFDKFSQRTSSPGTGGGFPGRIFTEATLGDHAVDEVAEGTVAEDVVVELNEETKNQQKASAFCTYCQKVFTNKNKPICTPDKLRQVWLLLILINHRQIVKLGSLYSGKKDFLGPVCLVIFHST